MEAIILAGGLGTRLRQAVPDLPKPMAPIQNRPFLEYLLNYWIREGVSRFVMSTGYLASRVQDHFGASYRGVPIEYSIEATPMGTGGGLSLALDYLTSKDPFLLLNGDTFFQVSLESFLQFHLCSQAEMTLALLRKKTEGRYGGIEMDKSGRVLGFGPEQSSDPFWINGGVYLISPKLARSISKEKAISLEKEILPSWLEKGNRIFGFQSEGAFIDIGVPEDYNRAYDILAMSDKR